MFLGGILASFGLRPLFDERVRHIPVGTYKCFLSRDPHPPVQSDQTFQSCTAVCGCLLKTSLMAATQDASAKLSADSRHYCGVKHRPRRLLCKQTLRMRPASRGTHGMARGKGTAPLRLCLGKRYSRQTAFSPVNRGLHREQGATSQPGCTRPQCTVRRAGSKVKRLF